MRALDPFKLLKVARESWQHFVSDEVIYAVQYGDIILGGEQGGYLNAYLKGDGWCELFSQPFRVGPSGYHLKVAILEAADPNLGWRLDDGPGPSLRLNDELMLGTVGEFPQDGKKVCFRSIRSVVRLKIFDIGDCSRENDVAECEGSSFVRLPTAALGLGGFGARSTAIYHQTDCHSPSSFPFL